MMCLNGHRRKGQIFGRRKKLPFVTTSISGTVLASPVCLMQQQQKVGVVRDQQEFLFAWFRMDQ